MSYKDVKFLESILKKHVANFKDLFADLKSARKNTFEKSYFNSCNFFPKINIGKLHCGSHIFANPAEKTHCGEKLSRQLIIVQQRWVIS